MATIIQTDKLSESFTGMPSYYTYNGLDCCLTLEIHRALQPLHTTESRLIYDFERGLQAPALEMMLRGMLVDPFAKGNAITTLTSEQGRLEEILNKLSMAFWGQTINPNSPKQLKDFFYHSPAGFCLPEISARVGKTWRVSTGREALEKILAYRDAKIFAKLILALRDLKKQLDSLRTGLDKDGRMRSSYNVAGTETGRWSSSTNAFGTGTNMQNQSPKVRNIFVADPGMKLAYIDLAQAESRNVGLLTYILFGDSTYLDACESGDLHTTVCKMVWPRLGWTDDPKANKKIANKPFYRDYSYRDMAKRGGHGTNYYGKPATMAKHLHVDTPVMVEFQNGYFGAFPAIPRWHLRTAQTLQTTASLTTPVGRKRIFFSRQSDDSTLREAIAFVPQSLCGDLLNTGLWRVWKHLHKGNVQLLAQIHDAIIVQYPEHEEDVWLPQIKSWLEVPCEFNGRKFTLPCDLASGWNWQKFSINNPDGIREWNGHDDRIRQDSPALQFLDRVIR